VASYVLSPQSVNLGVVKRILSPVATEHGETGARAGYSHLSRALWSPNVRDSTKSSFIARRLPSSVKQRRRLLGPQPSQDQNESNCGVRFVCLHERPKLSVSVNDALIIAVRR